VYMVDKPQNYLAQQCANFIYEITKNKQNKFNLFLYHIVIQDNYTH
jgi:hypothetical protein